jgi:GNAT superfamily N-acetyltransferase
LVEQAPAVVLEFHACPFDEAPASVLVQAMREEMAEIYDGLEIDNAQMPKAGATELGRPGGMFVVGFEHGIPVYCGGIKQLPDGACEIKRMFVVPEARGRGVARALLAELEERARSLGYGLARLDTGPRQTTAQRIYERAGYEPIGNFNHNPVASYFGEKRL